jgi:hypothetical protein
VADLNQKKPVGGRTIVFACGTASGGLLLASLFFPVFYLDRGDDAYIPGVVILLAGWMGVPGALSGDPAYLPWLANPLLLISLIFMLAGKRGLALTSAVAAFSLGLTTFGVKSALVNEAGQEAAIVGYGAGFYLWLSALGLPCAVGLALMHVAFMRELAESQEKEKARVR